MKYLKHFGLLLVAASILSACQNDETSSDSEVSSKDTSAEKSIENVTTDSEESVPEESGSAEESADDVLRESPDDENLNKIVEQAEDIESYNAELNMSATLDDAEPRDLIAEVSFVDSEPPELLLRTFGKDHMISADGKTYFNNEESWVDVSDSVDVDLLYSVTYDNAVASFSEIFNKMEVEESENHTIYMYEGNDADIYRTIQSLVQVRFGEMDIENVISKIKVSVNNETDLIEEISFDSDGTDTHGTFGIEGAATFASFNEVEDIELPEIIEE